MCHRFFSLFCVKRTRWSSTFPPAGLPLRLHNSSEIIPPPFLLRHEYFQLLLFSPVKKPPFRPYSCRSLPNSMFSRCAGQSTPDFLLFIFNLPNVSRISCLRFFLSVADQTDSTPIFAGFLVSPPARILCESPP